MRCEGAARVVGAPVAPVMPGSGAIQTVRVGELEIWLRREDHVGPYPAHREAIVEARRQGEPVLIA